MRRRGGQSSFVFRRSELVGIVMAVGVVAMVLAVAGAITIG